MTFIVDGTNGLTFNNSTTQNSGGKVLQVVNATYNSQTSTTTNTYVNTGLSLSITPLFSTSKILVFVDINGVGKDSNNTYVGLRLLRAGSNILSFETQAAWTATTGNVDVGSCSTNYLDSPATTSATTYSVQFNSNNNAANVYVQLNSAVSTITLMEIAG